MLNINLEPAAETLNGHNSKAAVVCVREISYKSDSDSSEFGKGALGSPSSELTEWDVFDSGNLPGSPELGAVDQGKNFVQLAFRSSQTQWMDDPVINQWRDPTHRIHDVLQEADDLLISWTSQSPLVQPFSPFTDPLWLEPGAMLAKIGLPWHNNQINMPDEIDTSFPFHFKAFEQLAIKEKGARVGDSDAYGYISNYNEANCWCIRSLQEELREKCLHKNARPLLLYDNFEEDIIYMAEQFFGLQVYHLDLSEDFGKILERLKQITDNCVRPVIFAATLAATSGKSDDLDVICKLSRSIPLLLHLDTSRNFDYITTLTDEDMEALGIRKLKLAVKTVDDPLESSNGTVITSTIVAGGANHTNPTPAVALRPAALGGKRHKVAYTRASDSALAGSRDAISPLWLALQEIRFGKTGYQQIYQRCSQLRKTLLNSLTQAGVSIAAPSYSLDIIIDRKYYDEEEISDLVSLGGTLSNAGDIVLTVQPSVRPHDINTLISILSKGSTSVPLNIHEPEKITQPQHLSQLYPMPSSVIKELEATVHSWKIASRSAAGYPFHMGSYSALGPVIGCFFDVRVPKPWLESQTTRLLNSRMEAFGLQSHQMSSFTAAFTNGSTMGNRLGIHAALKRLPGAFVYYSAESHYSVAKTVRDCDTLVNRWSTSLKPRFAEIQCTENGSISIASLVKQALEDRADCRLNGQDYHMVLFMNMGTTFVGAQDDLKGIFAALSKVGIKISHIHTDGALDFGFGNQGISLGFPGEVNAHGIPLVQGVTLSHHKAMGNMVSGEVLYFTPKIEYKNPEKPQPPALNWAVDPRIVFESWLYDRVYSAADAKNMMQYCRRNAARLEMLLQQIGIRTSRNQDSIIVVLERPSPWIIEEFSLRPQGDWVHFVTMPHVSPSTIDLFIGRIICVKAQCLAAFSYVKPLLESTMMQPVSIIRLHIRDSTAKEIIDRSATAVPLIMGANTGDDISSIANSSIRSAISVAILNKSGELEAALMIESFRDTSIQVGPLLLTSLRASDSDALINVCQQLTGIQTMASPSKISNQNIDESIAFNAPEGFAFRDATLDDVESITRLWYMTFYASHDFWKAVTPDTPAGRAWVKELFAISIRASPDRHRIFVVEDLAKEKKLVAFLRFQVPITDGTQHHNPIPEYPPEWDAKWLNGVWGGIANKRKEVMGDKVHWLGEFIGTDPAYKRQRLAFILEDWFCRQQDAFGIQGYHVATQAGRLFHQSLGYKDIGYDPEAYIDNPDVRQGLVHENEGQNKDPIAIVGLACKLPGEASSSSKFWDLLVNGRSGQCDFPSSRFNINGFYNENPSAGSINMKGGYFLQEELRNFENDFFQINNAEAICMDPQQRKLLEVVFECFESAGITLEGISGTNTGCYVGSFTVDYLAMQLRDVDNIGRHSMLGMGSTLLSNRISHVFNLQGPSMTVDTACSASMYCLHNACLALDAGDCDGAIIAAANLVQSIEQQVGMMKAGVLSKTSMCHTFDAAADGYGRADGVGVLYLKRLSDAIQAGDPIRAVIRGTSVNSNGRTQGISLPSADQQEKVIRKAYAKAGLNFDKTTYLECHGTGTVVGDPIEIEAISRVFKANSQPLRIGSVKTNIGHSEAASTLSGLIKVTMALENNFIPATVGIKTINPKLKCTERGVKIVTNGEPWFQSNNAKTGPVLLRAGVNSLGYGGANGHAILENAASHLPPNYNSAAKEIKSDRSKFLVPISASTSEALDRRINNLSLYMRDMKMLSVRDLVYTLACRRSHLGKRGYLLLSKDFSPEEISLDNTRTAASAISEIPSQFAFIFTGQGAQWPQMGMELLDEFPVFQDAFVEMDLVLQSLPEPPTWTLKEILTEPKETSHVVDPAYSQVICTAVQVALVLLLQSWNIRPAAVVGHSSGEVGAAFSAGFISLAEAITTAYYRGYVIGKCENVLDGAMIAAGISQVDAKKLIGDLNLVGKICVGCINSPLSVTMSGDGPAIMIMTKYLEKQNLFVRKLLTQGRAYHSHHMSALGEDYETLLEKAKTLETPVWTKVKHATTWISSVTGDVFHKSSYNHSYWRKNLEMPVEFFKAVSCLSRLGSYQLIELGPHSALELPIKQIRSKLGVNEIKMPYSATIIRNKNSVDSLLSMAGQLYLSGYVVSFDKINGLNLAPGFATNYRVVHDLPTYPWTYTDTPLWRESRAGSDFRFRKYPRHELLGSSVTGGNGIDYLWRNILNLKESTWLDQYKLGDKTLFPVSAYIAMIIEAIRQKVVDNLETVGDSKIYLTDVKFLSELVLPDDAVFSSSLELFTTLRPVSIASTSNMDKKWGFSITSFSDGVSTTHVIGTARIKLEIAAPAVDSSFCEGALEPSAPRIWYKQFGRKGLDLGSEFRNFTDLSVSRLRNQFICHAEVPSSQSSNGHDYWAVHPTAIESMIVASLVALTAGKISALAPKIVTRIGSVNISLNYNQSSDQKSWSIISNGIVTNFGCAQVNAKLIGDNNRIGVQLEDIELVPFLGCQRDAVAQRHPMSRVIWKPDPSPEFMTDEGLSAYLKNSATGDSENNFLDEATKNLTSCLNIIGHKNPYLRVLELGNGPNWFTTMAMNALSAGSPFPLLRSYTRGTFKPDNQLSGSNVDLRTGDYGNFQDLSSSMLFDLIIISDYLSSAYYLSRMPEILKSRLDLRGRILSIGPLDNKTSLSNIGLTTIKAEGSMSAISLIHRDEDNNVATVGEVAPVIVIEEAPTALGDSIIKEISLIANQHARRLVFSELTSETNLLGSRIISLLEIEKPILATATEDQFDKLKILTSISKALIWVTCGNLLSGQSPDHGIAFGLCRSIALEQPSLRIFTYDIDEICTKPKQTAQNIVSLLNKPLQESEDSEFIEQKGIVHVSRVVPDAKLNEAFQQVQDASFIRMPLEQVGSAELCSKEPGGLERAIFQRIQLPALDSHEIKIAVKSANLNSEYFRIAGGAAKQADCLNEFIGIIEEVGSNVKELVVGDRVYVMAPGNLRTMEVVPQWACQKLKNTETLSSLSVLPFTYASAIYAIENVARLHKGETILIHPGVSSTGMALIRLAQLQGARVFATVDTKAQKHFIIETFSIPPEDVFLLNQNSFESEVMAATNRFGVDVVINNMVAEMPHGIWKCCGSLGRCIDLSPPEVHKNNQRSPELPASITYTRIDLRELYASPNPRHHSIWAALIKQVFSLYRERKIIEFQVETSDIEHVIDVLSRQKANTGTGKITISLESPNSVLKVEPLRYTMRFDATKSYLMIGCLGGLGRSLARWMLDQGARKFVFLSRSGTKNVSAHRLVEDLENLGAKCTIVVGDVCRLHDVERMVKETDGSIGGVVQAAMGLKPSLFTTMDGKSWHQGIDPKVRGTWNIHNALKGRDQLDFFLCLSSVSGTVGSAAEGNYCAANHFLDNFACFRRSHGLPATAVGLSQISEVGYLHENPKAEALFLRKGFSRAHEQEGKAVAQNDEIPSEISNARATGVDLHQATTTYLAKEFGRLILMPAEKIIVTKSLDSFGMDSMVAAEFRSWFFKTFKFEISYNELLSKNTTMESLSATVVEQIA
ncbi:hypothetical protein Dda_4388 [Drechslerella dactyloides]|uniref:Polyketide synthase n=1 Tax=Drechslerella dactyloides TaxID=74499 RepID=A0AAD6IWS9_DREDA|nr:hypothetical protein Dda_4388 [Drechslerella dactyloides]